MTRLSQTAAEQGSAHPEIGADLNLAGSGKLPLFRHESIAFLDRDRFGQVAQAYPIKWYVVICLLTVIVGGLSALAITQSFARKVTAVGILRFANGEAKVFGERGGRITHLYVHEGDEVEVGSLLAAVSTSQISEAGQPINEAMSLAFDKREEGLRTQLAATEAGEARELELIQSQLTSSISEREYNRTYLSLLNLRKSIVAARLAAGLSLFKKSQVSHDELDRRQEAAIEVDQAIAQANLQEARTSAEIEELNVRLKKQPIDSALARGQLEIQLAELMERKASADERNGYELRATIAGRVTAVQVDVGQSINPERPLLTVTPAGSVLQAELYVPSRAAGFLAKGQEVNLMYDAFPYQRFGTALGVVTSISSTVLTPQEVAASLPIKEATYRVLVEIKKQTIGFNNQETLLVAGMSLSADIVLEDRTLAEWVLEPILGMSARR